MIISELLSENGLAHFPQSKNSCSFSTCLLLKGSLSITAKTVPLFLLALLHAVMHADNDCRNAALILHTPWDFSPTLSWNPLTLVCYTQKMSSLTLSLKSTSKFKYLFQKDMLEKYWFLVKKISIYFIILSCSF